MRIIVRSLSSFIVFVLLSVAQSAIAQSPNPLEGNGRAIVGGGALFRAQCATCHGADAKGISSIDAPDLTMMWAERQRTVEEVYNIIKDGVPGSIMPPHGLNDTELWMLVAYLQNAAGRGVIDMPAGSASNGAQLFATHCAECHLAKGQGGALGPNLTGITQRRSLDALIASVRQPSAVIGRGYKPVSLRTNQNETVEGVLKSEDAFSLQLLDRNQRLRAFVKADLRAVERPAVSLMPEFALSQLSESELFDILNYLDAP